MSMRLLDKSLRELAAGLRLQRFSASDLWREAREAMDSGEPRMNAYKLRADDRAERVAREADAAFKSGVDSGILQGIPVSVKDLYGVPRLPTFAGSARELPAEWQSAGPMVSCLMDEMAVITGKTHTVEFAFGALGLNSHWPTPRNPWDAANPRVPGGSSSGAGVSLCEGSAILALGSDTAGSVRIPATLTGNVGFKPTVDRWSTKGIVPLSPIFDTPGILARTVEDAFLAASEFDRRAFGDRPGAIDRATPAGGLRIGVPDEHFWSECDAGIAEGVCDALAELEKAGHRLVRVSFPEAGSAFELFRAGGTAGAELLAFLKRELPEWIAILDPNVGIRMEAAAQISAVEFLQRKAAFEQLASRALARFDQVDVIVTPTAPISPPMVSEVPDWERYRIFNLKMVRNTGTANLLRLCSLTMPVALDALGLPVGLQIMAAHNRDDLLFAAGLAFEETLGGGRQRLGS
ncbi:MAG: amidase [Pseudomonadota bacterium]|nr:amidase [Pseudomonadota bacterium]